MRKLNFLWALLASALFVVGCDTDNPNTGLSEQPEITIAEVATTFDSFTFEVTTTVEGTLGYAYVAEGYNAPKIDEMFAANSVEVNDKATLKIEGLNDNTTYTLYAVLRAANGGVLSAPKSIKFTTADDGVDNPITIKNTT